MAPILLWLVMVLCLLGLVTYPLPLAAAQLVVPAGAALQYSIWMAAQDVPPRSVKNEVT